MFHVYSYYLVLFVPSYEAQAGAELAQEILLFWLCFAMSNEFSFVSDPGIRVSCQQPRNCVNWAHSLPSRVKSQNLYCSWQLGIKCGWFWLALESFLWIADSRNIFFWPIYQQAYAIDQGLANSGHKPSLACCLLQTNYHPNRVLYML